MKYFMRAALCALTLCPISGLAQVPELINYQGRLIDGSGLVNATTQFVFRIFNEDSGGSPLYQETQTVGIVDGLYAVSLGASNGAPGELTGLLTNSEVFIEVTVGDVTLTPREKIQAVAYALRAAEVDLGPLDGRYVNVEGDTMSGSLSVGETEYGELQLEVGQDGVEYHINIGGGDESAEALLVTAGNIEIDYDGDVIANSFSGIGSGLTGVNADTLDGLDGTNFSSAGHTHDHGSLSGLGDNDHPHYLRRDVAETYNASGADIDFAFKAQNGNTILFTDASLDRIGIGKANPLAPVDIDGDVVMRDNVNIAGDLIVDISTLKVLSNRVGVGVSSAEAKLHVASLDDPVILVEDGIAGLDSTPFVIDGDGNVGVGTINPVVKLDINGTAAASAVGIGTTSPDGDLHIRRTSGNASLIIEADADNNNEQDNPELLLRQDGDGANAFIAMVGSNNARAVGTINNSLVIGSSDNDPSVQFVTVGETRMTIGTDGQVGVGLNNPSESLEVVGNIRASGDLIAGDDVHADDDVLAGGEYRYASLRTNHLFVSAMDHQDFQTPGSVRYAGTYLYVPGGSLSTLTFLYAPVNLPQGVTVTGITVYYYDNSGAEEFDELAVVLRRADFGEINLGGIMASVSESTGGPLNTVRSSSDTTVTAATIDNSAYKYFLDVTFDVSAADSSLRYYGTKITYTYDTLTL